jgi:hypothetical protein
MRRSLALILVAALAACSRAHATDAGADTGGGDVGADSAPGDTGGIDWGACALTSECTLARDMCCGGCPFDAIENLDGVNVAYATEHMAEVCPDPTMVGCEPCGVRVDPLSIPGHFSPCRAGRCTPVDIAAEPITECTIDADCRVRARDCCECGADVSDANLVAIRVDAGAAFAELACDADASCDLCAPVYPEEVQAVCDAGRCRLARLMTGP